MYVHVGKGGREGRREGGRRELVNWWYTWFVINSKG